MTTVAGSPYVRGDVDGASSLLNTPTSLVCLPDGKVLVGDPGVDSLKSLTCVSGCNGGGGGGTGGGGDDDKGGGAPAACCWSCVGC